MMTGPDRSAHSMHAAEVQPQEQWRAGMHNILRSNEVLRGATNITAKGMFCTLPSRISQSLYI